MCYRGPARTPLASAPAPSASDAASGPEASWRSRESKRAVVIWRLAQERRNGLRRHGGLTAKGKGARAGFKHDPTHLAALAAWVVAGAAVLLVLRASDGWRRPLLLVVAIGILMGFNFG